MNNSKDYHQVLNNKIERQFKNNNNNYNNSQKVF